MTRKSSACAIRRRLGPLLVALVLPSASFGEAGFRSIFNGTDLDGWEGNPDFWSVEDGAITGRTTEAKPTEGNTFLIWRQGEVDDFELRLKYRITGGNSGIQYRSGDFGGWVVGGYQADLEAGDTWSGILYDERGRGILGRRGEMTEVHPGGEVLVVGSLGDPGVIQSGIRSGDWNEYRIIARGNRLIHLINGRVTVEVTDEDAAEAELSGLLALQLHAGPPMTVQFKDIELRRLPLGNLRKVVFVAGTPSHGLGAHEHNAGCLLLADALSQHPDRFLTTVYRNGWPSDPTAFDNADTVVFYCDGGGRHYVNTHLREFAEVMDRGVGLVCLHYAVEVPKGDPGARFLDWIGGYFETWWSVNPHWKADFTELPRHPITRGVKPFAIQDEWYYHMRFQKDMEGVTPILTAVPPAETLDRPDGPHSGNPHVRARKGLPQHVAWAFDRPAGGRGFGFTGGHFHRNWGDVNFRKTVVNAIAWTAGAEIPPEGLDSTFTEEELEANQDPVPESASKERAPGGNGAPAARASAAKPLFDSGIISKGSVPVDVPLKDAAGLWLVVTDGGDGIGCDWADWIEPTLALERGETVDLAAVPWKTAMSGFGSVHRNRNAIGDPLRVGGETHATGIGVHSPSLVHFDFGSPVTGRFRARAGLDNGGTDQGCGSTVRFLVFNEAPDPALLRSATPGSEPRGHGPEAALAEMDRMTVADGLDVTLFASEPRISNPTNMDIDARGRVWITEGMNYRRWSGLRPEGDRIVILEDTDGDGRADRDTVFYQGPEINAALGICVLGSRVLVSCSPRILVFSDKNGDDRADGPPSILFNGIGGVQHDHGAHAFVFGPDGHLYFNVGNDGAQLKTADGSAFVVDAAGNEVNGSGNPYRQGLVFRCDLDGSNLETLGWNFRNNYEVAIDSFGTLWQSDNDDDGNRAVRINYVMEFGNFGYTDERTGQGWRTPRDNMEATIPEQHWHQNDPGVVPNLLVTGQGSPTGITVYEGDLLPPVFHDQILHCDAGPRVVRAYPVRPDGAGYSASSVDLLSSADLWFRPADVAVAPDGAVFVADWSDPGVGGHNMGDRDPSTMRGRVYRVAPPGHRSSVPAVDLTSPEGAAKALRSPAGSVRFLAWTALRGFGARAEAPLLGLWTDDDVRMRARALHLLARIPGREGHYLRAAFAERDPNLRITALRIARDTDWRKVGGGETLAGFVALAVRDSDPAVRRECAIALRHLEDPTAPGLWAELAVQHDGRDRWYLEALGIGADGQEDAFFDAWLARVGDGWNTPAGRDIIWRSRARKASNLLADLILDEKTSSNEKSRYVRALDFLDGPEKQQALLRLLTSGR